jgi:uncharacterized lipoprotein YddW (UPF0748 family)
MKNIFFLLLFFISINIFAQTPPQQEFRGVWVATVNNIDWPSKKGLSVDDQKAEFIRLADMEKKSGMNALIVQIRPAADAFYPSKYEPWSEFLTGQQGLAPTPEYDPLKFMIEETHKRGMEFHAWINPYRAVFKLGISSVSPFHITVLHPDWFIVYGDTTQGYKKYFDPGLPQGRNYVATVVQDLVSRYDIDAIHFDDYFYPYRIRGKEFADEKSYRLSKTTLNKEDWRRSNCDSIIRQIHNVIQSTKPYIKFGISPFGVWRNSSTDPQGSNTKAGQTCYDDLYADILLWLKKGWIDYVVPQLYWKIGHPLCDYNVLLKWWNEHAYGRQLYIGMALYNDGYSANSSQNTNTSEIPNEIKALREYKTTQGCVFFSDTQLRNNRNGISDSLQNNYFALPALIPPMKWIDSIAPSAPVVKKEKNGYLITYEGTKKIKGFAIYDLPVGVDAKREYATLIKIITADETAIFNPDKSIAVKGDKILVSAISVTNNISDWVELKAPIP